MYNDTSRNIGELALSGYGAWYDVVEFSNCPTGEKSEAEFFCAVWDRNDIVPCSMTRRGTTSHVLTVLKHSHMQSDVILVMHCSLIGFIVRNN